MLSNKTHKILLVLALLSGLGFVAYFSAYWNEKRFTKAYLEHPESIVQLCKKYGFEIEPDFYSAMTEPDGIAYVKEYFEKHSKKPMEINCGGITNTYGEQWATCSVVNWDKTEFVHIDFAGRKNEKKKVHVTFSIHSFEG